MGVLTCPSLQPFVSSVSIVTVLPIIVSVLGVNNVGKNYTALLQKNNFMLSEANVSSCEFLEDTIEAWLDLGGTVQVRVPQYNVTTNVLWAQVLPKRCDFQRDDGVITFCKNDTNYTYSPGTCEVWNSRPANTSDATPQYFANELGIRVGGVTQYTFSETSLLQMAIDGNFSSYPNQTFSVRVLSNQNDAIALV